MSELPFHKPSCNHSHKRQKCQNSSRLGSSLHLRKEKLTRSILVLKIRSQIHIQPNPTGWKYAKHCNFNVLGGRATGTYRFINGYYGLTDMPATFQKTIDKTLQNIKTKFAYLDDIQVITKGSLQDHENEWDKIMKKLNEENLAINLKECKLAKEEITWLGFKVTPNGVTPTKSKCDAIISLETPKTLKKLRSFMGCIHHLIKFLQKLAEISEPLRPLLSKTNTRAQNKLDWKEKHTEAFNEINLKVQNSIQTLKNKQEKDATPAKKDWRHA